MEVLEIAGYTENEKFHIGKQYLIPKQIKKNGLKKSQLVINDKALKTIISEYTREAGVRGLERQIGKICRKAAKLVVEEQQEKVRVSGKNIEEFLGKKKFPPGYGKCRKRDRYRARSCLDTGRRPIRWRLK